MPGRAAMAKANAKPLTPAKRKSLATKQLFGALNVTDKVNEGVAVTAALEVINEWLAWDTEMRRRLRENFEDLVLLTTKPPKPDLGPEPVPIAGPDLDHYNPYAKPDPYKLLEWYGPGQLRAVLVRMTPKSLRALADVVQAHNANTAPASRAAKPSLVDYIVEHVAGPGY